MGVNECLGNIAIGGWWWESGGGVGMRFGWERERDEGVDFLCVGKVLFASFFFNKK